MNAQGWTPTQQPQKPEVKKEEKKAEAPSMDRKFLGYELQGILKHMAESVNRPLKPEELPYFTFFYRFGEEIANLYNDADMSKKFMAEREREIQILHETLAALREDMEKLRLNNKPLQKQCNDQAEKISRMGSQIQDLQLEVKKKNDELKEQEKKFESAEALFKEILSYKGRSINFIKDKVKGFKDHGTGKEKTGK